MVTQRKTHFASDIEVASGMVARVEGILSEREGLTLEEIRPRVARALSVPVRTVLHIRNQRRKTVTSRMMDGLRGLLVDVLQAEIARLEHEVHIHKQIAGSHRDDDLAAVETAVAHARALLERAAGSG
jgi:hypothetical protein